MSVARSFSGALLALIRFQKTHFSLSVRFFFFFPGPTMAVVAQKCPDICVTVVDISERQIARWNSDDLPMYVSLASDCLCNDSNLT
jgi:hypothetical protein